MHSAEFKHINDPLTSMHEVDVHAKLHWGQMCLVIIDLSWNCSCLLPSCPRLTSLPIEGPFLNRESVVERPMYDRSDVVAKMVKHSTYPQMSDE
jgi:hypothetical protein